MAISVARRRYLRRYYRDPVKREARRAACRRWRARNRARVAAYNRRYLPSWWARNGHRVRPKNRAYKRRLRRLAAHLRRLDQAGAIQRGFLDQGRRGP